MDQQDQGAGQRKPSGDAPGSSGGEPQADGATDDSTWGLGSASAMEHLRRHGFRARRSKPPETDERPQSE